jgi:short-subunit dehydrogenase/acyl carrier protein
MQGWLGEEGLATTLLVILTQQAIACDAEDSAAGLPSATIWGLARSAQAENPRRIMLVDLDDQDCSVRAIPAAIDAGEPQIAVRNGVLRVPRLMPARPAGLTPPGTPAWHLAMESPGNLDTLVLTSLHDQDRPLAAGEVRVAVRAAGLCHRDALVSLGRYPKPAGSLGCEIAGVVLETGRDVTSCKAGDRVMGLAEGAIGPIAVTDHRCLTRIPDGWSFTEAATVPVAFLTAYYGLKCRASLKPGQKAVTRTIAAGTVMAATQLATCLGVEMLMAGSSQLQPSEADAVVDWLDLAELPPGQIAAMLAELQEMFARGDLSPLPCRAWDVRLAREAFRLLWDTSQAAKIVLTVPTSPDPLGTFLITGGTGALGGILARHLMAKYNARHLLLLSRQGDQAPGAHELACELRAGNAEVTIATCDVSDPEALRRVIDAIPAEHPLTYVAHAAGELADGTIARMSPRRLGTVLAAKVEGAWNLYQATRHADLSALVLFSSAAATWGLPGQGNYAAGNAFLDSLAADLRARGVPASALAWGTWAVCSGMADITPADEARLSRSEGLLPLDPEHALSLYDQAIGDCDAHLLLARLNLAALRDQAADGLLRPLLSALVPDGELASEGHSDAATGAHRLGVDGLGAHGLGVEGLGVEGLGADGLGVDGTLARLDSAEAVLDLVLAQTALVLDHPTGNAIDIRRSFHNLGVDSLTSLELSHRLSTHTGMTLPKSITSDYPTAADLATQLWERLQASATASV